MRKVQEQGKPKKKDGVLEKLLYFDKLFYGRKSTIPCTLFRGAAVPCPYSHIHFAFITQPSRTAAPAGSRRGTAHFRKPQNILDIP